MRPPREDTEPWYKQFWPWFLISLPLSVVIASIVTINLAIDSDDGLVSDEYYKEGLGIHKTADSAARAAALGIAGNLALNAQTGEVKLTFDSALATHQPRLTLKVVHPTIANRDQEIELVMVTDTRYAGRLEPMTPGNWKLELRPEDTSWRITGRMLLPGASSSRLD